MFSSPVNSGSKPAVSSSMALMRPWVSMVPLVGWVTPATIFIRVDLPEPFLPRMPTTSPLGISTDTWEMALNGL